MKVGLLGCGVVGSGVKEILDKKYSNIKVVKILVKDESEITEDRMTTDINELLSPDIDLIVECMGGVDIPLKYISLALNSGKHVVSSNKKVLATHYKELTELAEKNNVILAFEASVGGGIPWFENIRHVRRVDEIDSFEGIFNGTTNYILYNMTKKGSEFNIVLEEAKNLGYAEFDPTDDIDAHDVKYKCLLSANAIWDTSVELNDIIFHGIRNIDKKDIEYAAANNRIIKLIGRGEKIGDDLNLYVLPKFVDNTKSIAHIPRNLNCVRLESEFLGENSYMGQGAGKYPTAHAVVQDIVTIFENREISFKISKNLTIKNNYSSNFYIKAKNLEKFKDIILEKIDDTRIITKKISLIEIEKLVEENTFIAEMKL